MTKLEEEIQREMETYDRNSPVCFGHKEYAQVAAIVVNRKLLAFKKWYDKLSPAEKCTVRLPAGSGGGVGLYNMEDKDIVEKFLNQKV